LDDRHLQRGGDPPVASRWPDGSARTSRKAKIVAAVGREKNMLRRHAQFRPHPAKVVDPQGDDAVARIGVRPALLGRVVEIAQLPPAVGIGALLPGKRRDGDPSRRQAAHQAVEPGEIRVCHVYDVTMHPHCLDEVPAL
jgi:hypothetical protein